MFVVTIHECLAALLYDYSNQVLAEQATSHLTLTLQSSVVS